MRDLDAALAQFAYHPATAATAARHAALRDVLTDTVQDVWAIVPDGPEKTLAVRALQQVGHWGNLAIALQAPADLGPTRAVARVLPLAEPVPSTAACTGGGCVTCDGRTAP